MVIPKTAKVCADLKIEAPTGFLGAFTNIAKNNC
jgi:hypothetical protein